jgi:hypothetical protein
VTAKETIALTEAMIIGYGGSRFQHIVDNVRGRRFFFARPGSRPADDQLRV